MYPTPTALDIVEAARLLLLSEPLRGRSAWDLAKSKGTLEVMAKVLRPVPWGGAVLTFAHWFQTGTVAAT